MKIGIDGACLIHHRGFGRITRNFIGALARQAGAHRIVVFVDRPARPRLELPDGVACRTVDVSVSPTQAASAQGRRRLRDVWAMSRAVARDRVDLFYFPTSYSFFPVFRVPRVVVTVCDTLPYAYPELVFPTWRSRLNWTLKERLAVWQADLVFTLSHAARRDVCRQFGIAGDRVRVTPCAAELVFQPPGPDPGSAAVLGRYGLAVGQRYLLYVGGISPHKNLARLIEAFAPVAREPDQAGVRLVLVGDYQRDVFLSSYAALRRQIAAAELGDRVVFAGFVPDADLRHIYGHAQALVHPSLMEGFGLPPVEAMACGCPVASSTAGSLPEVLGAAACYFDPTDGPAITRAIRRLLTEPATRARLSSLGLERARQWTWDAAGTVAWQAFEELVAGSPRRSTDRTTTAGGPATIGETWREAS